MEKRGRSESRSGCGKRRVGKAIDRPRRQKQEVEDRRRRQISRTGCGLPSNALSPPTLLSPFFPPPPAAATMHLSLPYVSAPPRSRFPDRSSVRRRRRRCGRGREARGGLSKSEDAIDDDGPARKKCQGRYTSIFNSVRPSQVAPKLCRAKPHEFFICQRCRRGKKALAWVQFPPTLIYGDSCLRA